MAAVIAVAVAAMAAGTAWGAGGPSSAVITFDDGAHQVTLQIPDPPCTVDQPNCVWKFFLNEPKVSVDVATVYGQSGTLTLAYPPDFCGVIQADAYVGPSTDGPWVPKRGWQRTISSAECEPVTPTPAPTSSPPPTDEPEAGGSSSSPPPPEQTAAPESPPVSPTVAAAAVTPTTVTTTTEPAATNATAKTSATLTSLPFTGANIGPLVESGLALVTLGLCLLVRRRGRHSV
jgi:hypothetical protein